MNFQHSLPNENCLRNENITVIISPREILSKCSLVFQKLFSLITNFGDALARWLAIIERRVQSRRYPNLKFSHRISLAVSAKQTPILGKLEHRVQANRLCSTESSGFPLFVCFGSLENLTLSLSKVLQNFKFWNLFGVLSATDPLK